MSWALIAGGTKGIGYALAVALARRKYDLMLVARNETDLLSGKNRLQNDFLIQVSTMACDLSMKEGPAKIHRWCRESNQEISILCYVAGMGGPEDFEDLPLDSLQTMMRLNFESAVALCWLMAPLLKENSPSHVLLVGSLAGFAPIPQKNIYSASKSAIYFFGRSLRNILKKDQVSVSCLCPGPVFTKPAIEKETIKQLGWFGKKLAMKPEKMGEYAVQKMLNGKMMIIPGAWNRITAFFLRNLPHGMLARIYYRGKTRLPETNEPKRPKQTK